MSLAASHRPVPSVRHIPHVPRLVPRLVPLPPSLLREFGRGGPLESPRVAVAFGLLLLASVVVVVVRRYNGPRPSHRKVRRAVFGLWVLLLALLTVAAAANAYVGYVPTYSTLLGLQPGHGRSRVEQISIGDAALGVPASVTYVYLPPGYLDRREQHHRYPVIYLIHGYPGGSIDWFRAGEAPQVMDALVRYHLVPPAILVAPDANGGWIHDSECLDAVGGPRIATFLTGPLVHAIDARYRTIANRSGRVIGGMSSGGYCALNLGLRHTATYAAILSMMPYGDPGAVTDSLLGGSRRRWLANSPRYYIPTMTFAHPIATFLAVGAHDEEAPTARRLATELSRRHQVVVLRELPDAGHTWQAAREMLPYGLAFASAVLGYPGARPLPPPGHVSHSS